MGSFEPTPEQRQAMEDRGGSLLVSAAAGSGKTKVLVERLFGYMEQERCRIDDFLIITFTKAAAAELRGRIAAELSRRVAQPENMHTAPPDDAGVSGGHQNGGCLLREPAAGEHPPAAAGGAAKPDPGFPGAGSAGGGAAAGCRCWSRYWRSLYQRIGRGDTQAYSWRRRWAPGGTTGRWSELVLDIHGKIQSHAYPMRWLERLREQWQQVPESVGALPGGADRTASCGGPGSGRGSDGDGSVDGAVSGSVPGLRRPVSGDGGAAAGAMRRRHRRAGTPWPVEARLPAADGRRQGLRRGRASQAKGGTQAVQGRAG